MVVFLNGKFLPADQAQISVFDHGFLYGDGCFETLRTYQGKLFRVKTHLHRLFHSAQKLKITILWSIDEISQWMEQAIAQNGFKESRLRITITRGINQYNFCGAENPTLLITVIPLSEYPPQIYKNGAKIATLQAERLLPQVKSLNLLASTLGQQQKTEQKVFETVFINHKGCLTEGTVSNFFTVKKQQILTAPASQVLSGITREVVFELCQKLKIKSKEKSIKLTEAYEADEIFLTSTTMDILPIVKIDERKIGAGKVGPITKKLINEFYQYIYNDRP